MDVGIVGLAGAGAVLARRWACAGMRVAVFDRDGRTPQDDGRQLACALSSAVAVARSLAAPRIVWLCVPAGAATELAMQDVWPELAAGDVIVDVGDAHHHDAPRRAAALASVGIHFADCGMRETGADSANLLLGGSTEAARIVAPLARIAAGTGTFTHCGPAGAGHYMRMVNDIVNEAVVLRTPAPVLSLAAMLELGVLPADVASGPARIARSARHAAGAADDKDDTT